MASWDRLEDESERAYRAFCVYRDLGCDRSIWQAMKKANVNPFRYRQLWEKWNIYHRWDERCWDYDHRENAAIGDKNS